MLSIDAACSLWFRALGWVMEQQGKVRRAWPIRREIGRFRQIYYAQPGREESSQLRKGTHRWRYCHLSGNVCLNECC